MRKYEEINLKRKHFHLFGTHLYQNGKAENIPVVAGHSVFVIQSLSETAFQNSKISLGCLWTEFELKATCLKHKELWAKICKYFAEEVTVTSSCDFSLFR